MTNILNNTQRLADIQAQLPYGAQSEIARQLGISRTAVNQTLKGIRKTKAIQQAIFRYFVEWAANQPAPVPPVELSEVDQALAARSLSPTTK